MAKRRNAVGFLMFMGGWTYMALYAVPFSEAAPVLLMGLVAAIVLFTNL